MVRSNAFNRRRVLQLTGATAAAALLAGCNDEGPEEDDEVAVDDDEEMDDEEMDDEEMDDEEMDDEEMDDEEMDDEEMDDEEEENDVDGFEIEPDEQIVFDGQTPGWVGKEPDDIDGEENPTLILQAGEEYEIGWDEGDGSNHNIEIWDEDDELVEDYETDIVDDPDDDQMLEIEASEEMAYYVCEPHQDTMRGEIQVEDNGDDEEDNDEEEDNGNDDNGNDDNGNDDE